VHFKAFDNAGINSLGDANDMLISPSTVSGCGLFNKLGGGGIALRATCRRFITFMNIAANGTNVFFLHIVVLLSTFNVSQKEVFLARRNERDK